MSGFEERLAARIAAMVAEKVVDGLIKASSEMHGLTLHQLPGLRLTGLRLSQFERFCKLMRENPGMVPFRAATQALEELKGRGGYTRPSSLQRFAGRHRKFWWRLQGQT